MRVSYQRVSEIEEKPAALLWEIGYQRIMALRWFKKLSQGDFG